MERFVLSWKKSRGFKKNYKVHLVLEMVATGHGQLVQSWKVLYWGSGQEKTRMFLRLAEARGTWNDAEWEKPLAKPHPDECDARSMTSLLYDRDCDVGRVFLSHDDGMRFAMLMMVYGKIRNVSVENCVLHELRNLPSEEVLYWFTKCAYGYRQQAARAALFAFLGTKGDRA